MMEELRVCTHCWAKSPKGPAVCPYCQTPFPIEPDIPATPQQLGYTSKQISQARRIYNQHRKGRPKGYRIWLLGALLWGGLGYFGYNNGMISGTGDILTQTILVFGVPSVLMLLLFFLGNNRSKKTYVQRESQLKALDPRLVEFFAWQDDRNARMDEEYVPDEDAIREEEKEKRKDEKEKRKLEDIWIYD